MAPLHARSAPAPAIHAASLEASGELSFVGKALRSKARRTHAHTRAPPVTSAARPKPKPKPRPLLSARRARRRRRRAELVACGDPGGRAAGARRCARPRTTRPRARRALRVLEPAHDAQGRARARRALRGAPLATAHQLAADEAETLSATTANSLVYGEIDLAAFVVILREARAAPGAGARARAAAAGARPARARGGGAGPTTSAGAGRAVFTVRARARAGRVRRHEIPSAADESRARRARQVGDARRAAPRRGVRGGRLGRARCSARATARARAAARRALDGGASSATSRRRRRARRRRDDDDDDDERFDDRVDDASDDLDWSDGDIVFANSTCFDDELQRAPRGRGERLRPARCSSASRPRCRRCGSSSCTSGASR